MLTTSEMLDLAIRHHQTGNLAEAESLCRQVLQSEPQHVFALHLLGVVAFQAGRSDLACDCIGEVVRLKPDYAEAYSNLGAALRAQRRLEEAVDCLTQATQLKADYAEAYNNLGLALSDQGKLPEAVASLRQAVQIKPNYAEAHNNLGLALRKMHKLPEAISSLRNAVHLRPNFAEAYNNLGLVLLEQGQFDEGVSSFQHAVRCRTGFAEAHNNLGLTFKEQGKLEDAIAHLRQAVQFQPEYGEAHNNLGLALMQQGKWAEAADSLREAVRLMPDSAGARTNLASVLTQQGEPDAAVAQLQQVLRCQPDFIEAHHNLGLALREQGKLQEAITSLKRAVQLGPQNADSHKNLGMMQLLAGDFEQGWPEYDWRLKCREASIPPFRQPLWDGAPLQGRTILLCAEQGLGDTLQFIRYAPLVKERGGRVVAACPQALTRILAGCPGIDQLVSLDSLPAFDVYAPLLSLPRILGTTLATVPAKIPYLVADAGLVQQWQHEFDRQPGFKIGIAWQASTQSPTNRSRSIPLIQFAGVARLDGVRLYSLQKGPGAEQLRTLSGQMAVTDLGSKLDETSGAFMETAAVIRNLDLVITPDTAVAHIAGGLGAPVWVALPFVPDWRWLLHREDSPWYPTMRLFRQTERGDWTGPFERIVDEVRKLIAVDNRQAGRL